MGIFNDVAKPDKRGKLPNIKSTELKGLEKLPPFDVKNLKLDKKTKKEIEKNITY